ncbi:MAG: MBL fold metallo-hydrolase [Oscillospiraceae bacterium]|nr:MBL fold metallo-hydrolase [Oscillospiraceae bacterium]
MKMTWLGQAGLLFETENLKILIDPYLSDSVGKVNPDSFRRVPVEARFFAIQPDVLIFTHDHLDHYDPETVPRFLEKENQELVLAPGNCWQKARQFGGKHNYVLFNRGTEWTEKHVRFTAVPAAHSDPDAIGVIIEAEGKRLYVTGDTLYHKDIFPELPAEIDLIFLPINGVGNNMNAADAARFAAKSGAKTAVPVHWGMFDALDPTSFPFETKIIPEIYKEVVIE